MTDLTAPWSSVAEDAVRGPLEYITRVYLTHPDFPGVPIPLEVNEGSVTFDEQWSPHVQASVTIPYPDADMLELLDPRHPGCRITAEAGYRYPGHTDEDVWPLFDLGVRSREGSRPSNTMTLTAASDEALVQDAGSLVGVSYLNSTSYDAGAAVNYLLPRALAYTPTITNDIVSGPIVILDAPEGSEWWDGLIKCVDQADAWLYDGGLRNWHVRPRPQVASQAVHHLTVGPIGTVLESTSGLSREDEWASWVVVEYKWNDGTDHYAKGSAWVSSGPWAAFSDALGTVRLPGAKLHRVSYTTVGSAATGIASARAILARLMRSARTTRVRAKSAWWVRPGDTVTLQLPTGSQERHIVAATTFDLTDGTMTVRTRLPDDATISSTGE